MNNANNVLNINFRKPIYEAEVSKTFLFIIQMMKANFWSQKL